MLVDRSISPVLASNTRPLTAPKLFTYVYTPPSVPVCVTLAIPVAQYGDPAYDIVAVGNAVITTSVVVVFEHAPTLKL